MHIDQKIRIRDNYYTFRFVTATKFLEFIIQSSCRFLDHYELNA